MSVTVRAMQCAPERVFAVLANGWLYPSWVVGASRMREVDDSWPRPGSRLHHSVGSWPFVLDDETVCEEWDPPRRAVLLARGWPLGEARIVVEVRERPGGCVVRLTEDAVEGPGEAVPRVLREPLITVRNRETLRRLAFLSEGGAA
ncbi:activator of Hsp90 ATPase-like protein [Diaminobutyricimonas aerilata]|uniref:Activator of Hsp90 ATPase-like protein n=1 Tax=Diaminobutyricimonas aerilata TaxID=1162967 RepID=A0A2M9CHC1_9MICO|nr:SRPBCC family protein [Diaminobutyricimonas aerilata]PJJ71279.1 activator of Hsp90 ATPase-like protein [Diaminobutyricimonas aerilata]